MSIEKFSTVPMPTTVARWATVVPDSNWTSNSPRQGTGGAVRRRHPEQLFAGYSACFLVR